MKRRNYIGLAQTVHDPALAIVDSEGKVVFAEGTERYQQVKRAWNCVPDDIVRIQELLETHCDPGAEVVVARTWSGSMEGILKSFFYSRPAITALSFVEDGLRRTDENTRLGRDFLEEQARWLSDGLDASLRLAGSNLRWRARLESAYRGTPAIVGKILERAYDHHLTHAAASCFCSPFEEAVCAVVDGYGEKTATSFYNYRNGELSEIGPARKVGVPTSLGLFYLLVCWACGFDPYKGEEWKVMGLAPYGKVDPELYELLRPIIRVDGLRLVPAKDEQRRVGELLRRRRQPGSSPLESADLAHTGQLVFSEIQEQLLKNLYDRFPQDSLVLSGGCALNSSFNGEALDRTPFKDLYVSSAPGDDGNAVGAALLAFREDNPKAHIAQGIQSPYLGSSMSTTGLERLRDQSKLPITQLAPKEISEVGARLIADGKLLGWVQGLAEFGPRALGNRSILADPRRPEIKNIINQRVKFREDFRPFAPAILEDFGEQYFLSYQKSPYMERTLMFKPDVREELPGVVHVNGTGRLQTVERSMNERFYDLIAAFHRLTGVPIVLNTSFNVMGKPIIHSVEDAIAVYLTTGLDALIIEDMLIEND